MSDTEKSPPTTSPSDPRITAGTCFVLFAYDIGQAVRLENVPHPLREWTLGGVDGRPQPTPRYLDFKVPPLKVVQRAERVTVDSQSTSPEVEAMIFDFGAVSVTYRIPLQGPLSELIPLSSALYENAALLADSRKRVQSLVASLGPAVSRPAIASFAEDYAIFHISALGPGEGSRPAQVVAENRDTLARILRSDTRALSAQEVEDSLASRIAYGADEEAIIDWNGSVLFQEESADVRTVLEYANVALLEMRWLDEQLDRALDRSYEALVRAAPWRLRRSFPLIPHKEIQDIARLQTDAALLLEGVTNALKFVGDPYLARLYRLAARRMHLAEWDASILRKLQTVESIYQKLSDQAATRRLEALEWIVIVLIAVEILMALI